MIGLFNNFFIMIGGLVLSMVNFLRNISFDNVKINRNESEIDSNIFTKLNFDIEPQKPSMKESKFDEIRDRMLEYMLNRHIIIIFIILGFVLLILVSPELFGIYLMIVVMSYIFILSYPKMKEQRGYSDINQELPYALRHMGIELKSGKGLHDTLITIKDADYGSLSKELNRVLEEIKFGNPTEDSLIEMTHRVNSEGLTRAIHQIISTLRVGGNLANSLEIIAQDISFDMQIKLKEYSQKLNSFILIYTFIAILAPVISLIMLMAGSTVMGDVISSELLFVIYTIFFPLIVVFMGVFIKKLEPKI